MFFDFFIQHLVLLVFVLTFTTLIVVTQLVSRLHESSEWPIVFELGVVEVVWGDELFIYGLVVQKESNGGNFLGSFLIQMEGDVYLMQKGNRVQQEWYYDSLANQWHLWNVLLPDQLEQFQK